MTDNDRLPNERRNVEVPQNLSVLEESLPPRIPDDNGAVQNDESREYRIRINLEPEIPDQVQNRRSLQEPSSPSLRDDGENREPRNVDSPLPNILNEGLEGRSFLEDQDSDSRLQDDSGLNASTENGEPESGDNQLEVSHDESRLENVDPKPGTKAYKLSKFLPFTKNEYFKKKDPLNPGRIVSIKLISDQNFF